MNLPSQPVQSFPPVSKPDATVLVLGSMPGLASLNEGAYYAHPRNAFWPIAIACFSDVSITEVELSQWPYEQRLQLLRDNHVALWDVLAECIRPGSLDSAIDKNSVAVNPIPAFLEKHPSIERIIFNGKAAQDMFKRHIQLPNPIDLITMPSTSPAMATLTPQQKHALWEQALGVGPS